MKKVLIFLFTVPIITFSQTTVWSDDFNDEDITDWTLYDEDGDSRNWGDVFQINDSNEEPVTPVSLISRSWQTDPLTPDNYAVSPLIDLTAASGLIELKYTTQVAAASWDQEVLSVYIGTANDVISLLAATLTTTQTLGDETNSGTPVMHTLDLSSMAGQSIYIAFRHHDCTDQDFVSVDDVSVEAETLSVEDIASNAKPSYLLTNPIKDDLKINLSDGFDFSTTQVHITDMKGKLVMTATYSETINVSALQKGIYIINISDGINSENLKLIKK